MIAVDSPPGITRPSRPSRCSGFRTSTGSAPSRRSTAACSRKSPWTARTPIFINRRLPRAGGPKIRIDVSRSWQYLDALQPSHKGRVILRRMLLTAGLALIASAVVVTVAVAAKPGNGQSTGTATVFLPNPVADLQNQSLTDQKDADYVALAPAYHRITLTNLDGSGFLRGDWANITSETGNPAYSPTNDFNYHRNDDRFEQVMAYYWVTEAQKYIQSLGFGSTRRPVNMESQDLRINQWGQDNSFSWDKKDMIKLGKGGVDDAEDAEVILHELGHAIQDSQQTPFGFGFSVEARSIGEGFADYWAATVSNLKAPTPDPACIADWDSVSYDPTAPHC